MYRGGHQQTPSRGRYQRGGTGVGTGGNRTPVYSTNTEVGRSGPLACNFDLTTHLCDWQTHSELALKLHRADRHLLLPAGGAEELERIDPLLEDERKEKAKKARRKGPDEVMEEHQSSLITGLNISLSTPELIEQWVAERKKRWPSRAVVEKKIRESWDTKPEYRGKGRAMHPPKDFLPPIEPPTTEQRTLPKEKVALPSSTAAESNSASSSSSSSSSDDEEASGSDMDPEKDAVSSKIAPQAVFLDETNLKPCRFYQQGRCSFGDKCRDRHDAPTTAQTSTPAPKKRKRPRMQSPNPFEAPHLLRALLKNEIAQHVNYVAQVIRFLVRNEYLIDVEEKEGDAAAQARRKNLVVEEPGSSNEKEQAGEKGDDQKKVVTLRDPLIDGGLPLLGNTIMEPALKTLRPLQSLALPPEPDAMAFMDPLRANDAKPLLHAQYHQIAIDGGIRMVLLDDQGKPSASFVRALSTLDALPSNAHRSSAIEQILGVSEQSQLHPHQIGPTFVRSDRNPSSSRVIGESELFRCGLRVGPLEIGKIRQLAARISHVVGGPSFEVDEGDEGEDSLRPWWDKETREMMRTKKYAKEADWRDQMKKLGLEVD
ncbi:hypothetical protein CBS101457_003569 [Exobasidium rhododendri]|nr:hypothetical protein CBS101457_003569 [Exobasidium rhododendri]